MSAVMELLLKLKIHQEQLQLTSTKASNVYISMDKCIQKNPVSEIKLQLFEEEKKEKISCHCSF
jgi:hypothetical protein